jgi:hypothetical protein
MIENFNLRSTPEREITFLRPVSSHSGSFTTIDLIFYSAMAPGRVFQSVGQHGELLSLFIEPGTTRKSCFYFQGLEQVIVTLQIKDKNRLC